MSQYKRKFLVVLFLALFFIMCEMISAYFLFWYQRVFGASNLWAPGNYTFLSYSQSFSSTASVALTLINKISTQDNKSNNSLNDTNANESNVKVLLNRDEKLGWSALPGEYRIVFKIDSKRNPSWPANHDWTVTIRQDGSRATSRYPVSSDRKIHIFGDSWIFGWALDDELTMPWLLQAEYSKKFEVKNHSSGGWGHTHALINYRKLKKSITKNDVLIFAYAQYLLPRNLPHPSVVASLAKGLDHYKDEVTKKPLGYPIADISNNQIRIRIAPLDCDKLEGYCSKPDFTLEQLELFTIKLFDEIISESPAQIYILHLDGPDDNVLKYLRTRGVKIIDGKQKINFFSNDTMNPYDAHPGPIFNHHWFSQLRTAIDNLK